MLTRSLHRTAWAVMFCVGFCARPAAAWADDGSGMASTASFLVDAGLFVVILACLLSVFKLHGTVRGGKVALGWRWFIGGFAALGAAQVVLFAGAAGLLIMPALWVGIIRVIAVVFFLIGATRMRKLLT